jgi:thiol-disulfide isomerase/thioredoxin
MKIFGGTVLACATLLLVTPAQGGDSLCVGSKAPTFYLPGLDGSKFFLSSHIAPKGHTIVMVDFFATWCVPCRRELPFLVDLAERHAADSVLFVMIDVGEGLDTVQAWVSSNTWQRPMLLDRFKAVSGKYGVKALPSLFIIDRNGVLRYRSTGFEEKTGGSGAAAILDSLASRPAPVSDTPGKQRGSGKCRQKEKRLLYKKE